MEVHFTPEQEAELSQIATQAGTDSERLVKDAALRLIQDEARFRAAVREGIAQADRGEFIEEDEMDTRFEAMLRLLDAYPMDAGCQNGLTSRRRAFPGQFPRARSFIARSPSLDLAPHV